MNLVEIIETLLLPEILKGSLSLEDLLVERVIQLSLIGFMAMLLVIAQNHFALNLDHNSV